MIRFQDKNKDAIYPYLYSLVNEFTDESFRINLNPLKKHKTDFKILDIRKIDNGYFKLHEDYILSYDYSDGWTERLLHVQIHVNILFECKLEIRFSRDYRINKEDRYFDKQFECEIPSEIKSKILEIMNLELLTLKNYYTDKTLFFEDPKRNHYVINHNGESHNIITEIWKKLSPENPSEKLFFDLNNLLDKWREELYQEFLNDY